jgi:hypothetical protein
VSGLLAVPLTRRLHRMPVVPLLHGTLAERAWSWDWHDQWTRDWWPQGITWAGERLLVSWYAKAGGSRLSVVDLDSRRYAHVTLLTPAGESLKIHAGGLAWIDGWLYVAATAKGFWTLHESDLAPAAGRAASASERRRDPVTWQARAVHRPEAPNGGPPLRWSFLDAPAEAGRAARSAGDERRRDPDPAMVEVRAQQATKPTHLYAGEYGRGKKTTRLWRLPVSDGQPSGPVELLATGPKGMQGVTATNEGLVVSTSHGPWTRGSLHRLRGGDATGDGRVARSASHARPSRPRNHAATVGVEDLTRDGAGHLWTPAEHPGRRGLVGLRTLGPHDM